MSDIVERLLAEPSPFDGALADEAAAEIRRLRAMHHEAEENANKAKVDCEHWAKDYGELQQKMADLRVVANYNREQARSDALEEAAKVAVERRKYGTATAIRALKEKP